VFRSSDLAVPIVLVLSRAATLLVLVLVIEPVAALNVITPPG